MSTVSIRSSVLEASVENRYSITLYNPNGETDRKGNPAERIGTFKLPSGKLVVQSGMDVVRVLRKLGNQQFPISLTRNSEAAIGIGCKAIMKGADLAGLLVNKFGILDTDATPSKPEDMTKAQLADLCKEYNLDSNGSKSELLARINTHLNPAPTA